VTVQLPEWLLSSAPLREIEPPCGPLSGSVEEIAVVFAASPAIG